jgi:hypothetical protein
MLGHKQIINLRKSRQKPKTVFVHIGNHIANKNPLFHPENALYFNELPSVYTGKTTPSKADLSWVHGLKIQLLPCNDIELWVKWWIALVDAKPQYLIGIDTDGEINEWRM